MSKIDLTSSMDDLDRLLDEAEEACSDAPTKKKNVKDLPNDEDSVNDDVSRILEEFNCPPTPPQDSTFRGKSASKLPTTSKTVAKKLRCSTVLLCPSLCSRGRCTPSAARACDTLLCLTCNHPVVAFDQVAWLESTDYLFLRNNIPDFSRLKGRLRSEVGCRAYACQCQWRNIRGQSGPVDEAVQWVCRGHQQ